MHVLGFQLRSSKMFQIIITNSIKIGYNGDEDNKIVETSEGEQL